MDSEVVGDEPTSFKLLNQFHAISNQFQSIPFSSTEVPSQQESLQEVALLNKLCNILDEYQEQSYLLDPHLERLVGPLIRLLRDHATTTNGKGMGGERIGRLTRLIYFFTKVRGAKTILRLFPHSPSDFPLLLSLLSPSSSTTEMSWETHYVLLLWFSLVIMLPFPLSPSHKNDVGEIVEVYLGKSSIEREAAVRVLGRIYARADTSFESFLERCKIAFKDPTTTPLYSSGLLSSLCQILKLSPPSRLLHSFPTLYNLTSLLPSEEKGTLVAKYRIKLLGRLTLLRLTVDGEEETEVLISEIMEFVSHEETIIRYSTAKYLARIGEKLGEEDRGELVDAVLGLLEESLGEGEEENRIHGAMLALAELCRRGCLREDGVERALRQVFIAMHYDYLRSFLTIGTPIRDASSYFLWSLSRVFPPLSPSLSLSLAQHLLSVALFDKEISIRRSASAAFQEMVGRWGNVEGGLDLLRKVDFWTVGVRKRAFVEASREVAEYEVYRGFLVRHLKERTLRHYEMELRILGGVALEGILRLDGEMIGPLLLEQCEEFRLEKEMDGLHGLIVSLGAIAGAAEVLEEKEKERVKIKVFESVTRMDPKEFVRHASSMLVLACLRAVEKSVIPGMVGREKEGWWRLIEAAQGMGGDVHDAAGEVMRIISGMVDVGTQVDRLIAGLSSRKTNVQPCSAAILGKCDYSGLNKSSLGKVVGRLRDFVSETKEKATTVEGKRNGIEALSLIMDSSLNRSSLPSELLSSVHEALLAGFYDYTIDQRGDVGSWVRVASIKSFSRHSNLDELNQQQLDSVVANLMKQGVEKLDNVREAAGKTLEGYKEAHVKRLRGGPLWDGFEASDEDDWRKLSWSAERIYPFLRVREYGETLLEGVVLGITPHSTNSSFLDFASDLPLTSESVDEYTLLRLLKELRGLAKKNFSVNRIFTPTLGAFGILLENGLGEEVAIEEGGLDCLKQVLLMATQSVAKVKSAPRLSATVKIVVNLVSLPEMTALAAERVAPLLAHPMPWLRQQTAEELYSIVSAWDDEELQEILSETVWTNGIQAPAQADKVRELLVKRSGML